MERFAVFEGFMEDLEKKVRTIQRKCEKFGCEFHFEKVGEEIREVPDPNKKDEKGNPTMVNCKFILCDVEGTAVINGWEFVASVEHTEKGNIFMKAPGQVEIPERYRNSDTYCEHCNSSRNRKGTFLVRNTETGEFKQVGHNCLADFTHGMSATWAAYMASLKTIFEEYEEKDIDFGSFGYRRYRFYETREFLQYAAETIRHFGYVKSDERDSTKLLVSQFYAVSKGNTSFWDREYISYLEEKMESVGFDPESESAVKMTDEALEWLNSQEECNDYMHNIKVAASLEYTDEGKFGLLVSLFPTWNRALEREAQKKAEEEAGKASEFVGNLGQRIDVQIESVKCITSWETCYGTTYVWKIVGMDGNIYTWKTSTYMNEDKPPVSLKGTVKEHKTFRDVKQTELTRCKLTR